MMSKSFKLYYLKSQLKRKRSGALDIGTALHESLLEPHLFNINNYSLTASETESLSCMINNGKLMFGDIFDNNTNELSCFYKNKDLGLMQKIRIDSYDPRAGIIYDLKSSKSDNAEDFAKDAYKYGYHIQCAFYIDVAKALGMKVNAFAFMVVPSVTPFEPFCVQATQELMEQGRSEYGELIDGFKEWLNQPSQPLQYKPLNLPTYIRKMLGLLD
jgi:hypothetical protein